jgi:hypothetical protein
MLEIVEFDIADLMLRNEWDKLVNNAKYELLNIVNSEYASKYSEPILLYLYRNFDMEIYKMKLFNAISLEYKINDKDIISLNELLEFKIPKEAIYISSTFPHIFSLVTDSQFFESEKSFYKRVLKKNESFESLSTLIDGKIENKMEYEKALYLFVFLKASEKTNLIYNFLKKPITIVLYPENELRQIDNILFLLYNTSADEIIKSLIFRGKYRQKPEKKEDYILYNFENNTIIIPLREINEYTESKFKVKFEKMSPLAFYRKISKVK